MKIIIPVSQSDQHLLDPFIQMLVAQGPIGEHDVVFIPTANCADAVQAEYKKLANLCRIIQVVVCPRNWEGGWPVACNNHWHFAVSWLDNQLNKDVWLWLELDTVFTVPTKQVIQQLMEKYTIGYGKGQIFLGTQQPVLINGQQDHGDLIMNGVAIYPPMVSRFPTVTPLFNNMGRTGNMGIRQPFDMYLRWQFRKLGVNNVTPLIAHHWKSKEYTRKGDVITFKKEGDDTIHTLSPETVLAHGCKDGSLHRLMTDKGVKTACLNPSFKEDEQSLGSQKPPINVIVTPIEGMMASLNTKGVILKKGTPEIKTTDHISSGFVQVVGETQPTDFTITPNEQPLVNVDAPSKKFIEMRGHVNDYGSEPTYSFDPVSEPDNQSKPHQDDIPECLKVDTSTMNEKELKAFNVLKAQYEWLTKEQRRIQDFKITFDLLQKEANEVLSQLGMKTQQGGKIVKL